MKVECAVQSDAIVGESPVWSDKEQVLYWVDILGKKLFRFNPETKVNQTLQLDQTIASIGIREKGGLIAALHEGFAHLDWDTKSYTVIDHPERDKPQNRFNDGKCDRQGCFWGGTMHATKWDSPTGSLYRLKPSGELQVMQNNTICSNGLDWSPDNKTFYFTESFRYTIYAYDYCPQTGSISNRRVFAKVDPSSGGFPDGLCVDAKGFVWSAHCNLSQIVRYTPKGVIDSILPLPVPKPTSCGFGSKDLDVLYITTARENLTKKEIEKYPLSGSLLAVSPGIKGISQTPFQG